jgi:Uma2 family endonuclease
MATKTLLTIEDFEKLPEEMTRNHELVEGELVEVSGNVPAHNRVRDRLSAILLSYVDRTRVGSVITEQEYGFGRNVHAPDVSFIRSEKQFDDYKRVQRFTPDLAIEIASENDTQNNLLVKKQRYRKAGVAEVWIISIETREILIYSEQRNLILSETDLISTPLLPGFSISLEEIFRLSGV